MLSKPLSTSETLIWYYCCSRKTRSYVHHKCGTNGNTRDRFLCNEFKENAGGGGGVLLSHTFCRDSTMCDCLSTYILRVLNAVSLWITYFVLAQVSNWPPGGRGWCHWSSSFWASPFSCRQARSLQSVRSPSLSAPKLASHTMSGWGYKD